MDNLELSPLTCGGSHCQPVGPCFSVIHEQWPGDRWCVGCRKTLLSFLCWVSGEKIDERPQTNGVRKRALAKTTFSLYTCSAGCRIHGCLWSLIIYSARDGLYIPPFLSLTSVMEVISLAVTFCFSVVLLNSLSIFN